MDYWIFVSQVVKQLWNTLFTWWLHTENWWSWCYFFILLLFLLIFTTTIRHNLEEKNTCLNTQGMPRFAYFEGTFSKFSAPPKGEGATRPREMPRCARPAIFSYFFFGELVTLKNAPKFAKQPKLSLRSSVPSSSNASVDLPAPKLLCPCQTKR